MGSCVSDEDVALLPKNEKIKNVSITPIKNEEEIKRSIDREYLVDYVLASLEQGILPSLGALSSSKDVYIEVTPDAMTYYSHIDIIYNKKCQTSTDMVKKAIIHLARFDSEDSDDLEEVRYPQLSVTFDCYNSVFYLRLICFGIGDGVVIQHDEDIVLTKEQVRSFLRLIVDMCLKMTNCRKEELSNGSVTYFKWFDASYTL